MTTRRSHLPFVPPRASAGERGSLLITAMLLTAAIAIAIVGYLNLSRTALKLSHRTYFANDASNLAEAGLEEAIYCFNLMAAGTAPATAWTGWTISTTNAMRTLTPFNRDENAIGTVKIYVRGFDGSNTTPYVVAQATITPFDGTAPVVKAVQIKLRSTVGASTDGVVGTNGMTVGKGTFIDSFNSNPSASATGPWSFYPGSGTKSNAPVTVLGGTVTVSGNIFGNLKLGSGVTPPPASSVSGTIQTNYSASFPLPAYPVAAALSHSSNVGSSIPTTLPRGGDLPAADGRYYYFCNNTTIGNVTISAGKNVTITGTATDMSTGLVMNSKSTCYIFMDGPITLTKGVNINTADWAGALQITTSTASNCTVGSKSQLLAVLYAPNAAVIGTGGAKNTMIIGKVVGKTVSTSGSLDIHYDEALGLINASTSWSLTSWYDLQSAADRATLGALTANFLP